ncbi:unnamed protein product [Protopolystoma xenopodis]|uniref:Uncharacterized protein n=1 Tax=Protopolystoma xenopodis TaxID=117903 RepID=A0A3S5BAW1_9PLAT|nr:unnamed protein product [Protopolystoma xenopodis]
MPQLNGPARSTSSLGLRAGPPARLPVCQPVDRSVGWPDRGLLRPGHERKKQPRRGLRTHLTGYVPVWLWLCTVGLDVWSSELGPVRRAGVVQRRGKRGERGDQMSETEQSRPDALEKRLRQSENTLATRRGGLRIDWKGRRELKAGGYRAGLAIYGRHRLVGAQTKDEYELGDGEAGLFFSNHLQPLGLSCGCWARVGHTGAGGRGRLLHVVEPKTVVTAVTAAPQHLNTSIQLISSPQLTSPHEGDQLFGSPGNTEDQRCTAPPVRRPAKPGCLSSTPSSLNTCAASSSPPASTVRGRSRTEVC